MSAYYNIYCDICSASIGKGDEYIYHEKADQYMCSESCFEKYAIEYMEDEVSYCINDNDEDLI